MLIQAAVTRAASQPMQIEDIEIEEPRPDEILVRVVGTGICHTDVVMRDQGLPTPQPVVLGHEGSGVVEKIGRDVTVVEVGDHVVLSFNSCGRCPSCSDHAPSYCHAFFPLNFLGARMDGTSPLSNGEEKIHGNIFGQSSFASHALCNEHNVVKVDKDLDLALLGPLGCGILTGAGSVFNALQVRANSSIAIFGVGAVGLSAVMAAKVAGATTIIAVDRNQERLGLAIELGATHAVNGAAEEVGKVIRETAAAGIDYALDTTANNAVINTALESLAPRGVCGLIGATAPGEMLTLDAGLLLSGGRTLKGIIEGSADPAKLIPKLISHYKQGEFPFDKLVRFYEFSEINQAFADAEAGLTIKPVLRIGMP